MKEGTLDFVAKSCYIYYEQLSSRGGRLCIFSQMEDKYMKTSALKRMLALLLCFAMLLPNLTGLVWAAEESTGTTKPDSEQTTPEDEKWVPVDPTDIPAYNTAGSISNELEYDCGNGLSQDGAQSHMTIVTGTTEVEFNTYLARLTNAKFTKLFDNKVAGNSGENIFTRWLSPNGDYVLLVYFLPAYGETHIIADTAKDIVKSYAAGFQYEGGQAVTTPMMTMWGLSMSPNGYDNTTKTEYSTNRRNCGALIVIRMPDNSLFINDGGDIEQWSDEVCADFLDFCRKITGTAEGEKVVINTWFISHAHTDHYLGLPRFIDKFHDAIDIKNVMYNFDDERLDTTRDVTPYLQMVKAYFPNVKYYKPHTGDQFTICGIEFDVLYSQEERFAPDAQGNMIIDIRDGDDSNKNKNQDGTYRDFLYEPKEVEGYPGLKVSDFNDTSTALKVTFPKEVTGMSRDYDTILYGDLNLADQVLIDLYGASVLETDIMMVPHHGHDPHPELVAMSKASIFMYTQVKGAIYGPDGDYNTTEGEKGLYRPALWKNFMEMHDLDGEKYFDTVAGTRKTYWEGDETAVIFFGDDVSFDQAAALGMTRDSEDPAGFTVYTKAAPSFEYGGWTVLSDVVGMDSAQTVAVTTPTHVIRGDAVEQDDDDDENNLLKPGEKYIIVHDQTDFVLNYNTMTGTDNPPRPGSLIAGTRPNVVAGLADVYFTYSNGTTKDTNIYFTQHMRDGILWEFTLEDLTGSWPNVGQVGHNESAPAFGGNVEEYFFRSYWRKGLSSEAVYWYTDATNADSAWRYLTPVDEALIRTTEKYNFNTRVEFFVNDGSTDVDGDGVIESCDTCVIYYCKEDNNGVKSDLRFLTVDSKGNWVRKTYDTVEDAQKDLASLKLRLYRYNDTLSDFKKVDSVGPQTYYTALGTGKASIVDTISYQLNVRDSFRHGISIPCSGTTPKVGYYWLDGDFDTSEARQSTITVKYRNDDGSDTTITELTLHVLGELVTGFDVTANGMAATNSPLAGNVYESRNDQGTVTDRTMSLVLNTADGYVRQEISVNLGMLTYNENSKVNGNAVAGDVGGIVDTAVDAGTEYTDLTLSYWGMVITDSFTLTVEEISALDQPEYPEGGSVKVDKTGKPAGSSFFSTGVANIQLSATGIPQTEGVDLIIMLDMSGSMTQPIGPTDATERLDALKSSMKGLISTLQKSDVDFRVAISDFGDLDHFMFDGAVADDSIRDIPFFDANNGTDWNKAGTNAYGTPYEFYNHLNYVFATFGQDIYQYTSTDGTIREWTIGEFNAYIEGFSADEAERTAEKAKWTRGECLVDNDNEAQPFDQTITKWNTIHPMYTGTQESNIYTGSTSPDADAYVSVKSKSEDDWDLLIEGFKQGSGHWYGTNYDRGLETVYRLGYSIRQENIAAGKNREVVAVFMSDGAPMQFNYFSGRTNTQSWSDWFTGRIDPDKFQSTAFSEENVPSSVTAVCDELMTLLKNGELMNPDRTVIRSSVAEDYKNENGTEYTSNGNVWPFTQPGGQDERLDSVELLYNYKGDCYFNLNTENAENWFYFYTAMQQNGILLDEALLYRIAAANGIENFTNTPEQDAQLLALAKADELKYPVLSGGPYYPKYEGESTDFFAVYKEITGQELTWNKFVQIAYRQSNAMQEKLRDIMAQVTTLGEKMEWGTLSPYAHFYNAEGKNWWAEAIKGDTDKLYPVINKYAYTDSDLPLPYYGTVREDYQGQAYMSGFRGLGIPIYTLGLSIGGEGYLSNDDTVQVLDRIASGNTYSFMAYSSTELNDCFAAITNSVTYAATLGYYTDTLGDAYDLLTTTVNGVTPVIEVREYELDENHNRTDKFTVLENVTFEPNNVAKSTAVFQSEIVNETPVLTNPDIWGEDGIIRGKYFRYNTTSETVRIDLTGDGKGDFDLLPETFFWILGTIGKTEQVLEYPVYLSGSDDEDSAPKPKAGDYATNKEAVLHYVNYRGNNVTQDTVSPVFPWGKARVGYGFYLVDDAGKPIVNMFTGATGSIENAVKLTSPVYQNVTWGVDMSQNKISSFAKSGVLPAGYLLYVTNVTYGVEADSDGSGKWDIQSDTTGTTYVQYGSTFTNATVSDSLGLTNGEIHDTVVWFAVKLADPLTVDKTVEETDDGYTLTLEAFANASTSQLSEVEPADIVLVLDQSSSMYTPLGWDKDRVNLEGGDSYSAINSKLAGYKISDFVTQANTAGSDIQENAKRLGYYIAVHNSGNYMYLVHYAQNSSGKWGWYYISLDQTTRSIDVDALNYDAPSNDSSLGDMEYKLCQWDSGAVFTGFSYYKTQYGALVESVEAFISGLRDSKVAHRVGIVGFASPFYDGWDHYDGTGLYVDGQFYLYDTDFMYKGWANNNGTYQFERDAGFDEATWTGASASNTVILDPNTSFINNDTYGYPLSSDVIENTYLNGIVVKDANGNIQFGEDGKALTRYGSALSNIQTNYDGIMASVDAINANYQQTCPSVGIEIAENIFAARSAETADRDKIVILFTDGVPTVRLYSNRHHGYSSDIYAKALYWSISGGVEDALDRAVQAKDNGVQIYTIGTAAMENATIAGTDIDSGDFLTYLSSNYAAVTYGEPYYSMISTGNTNYQTAFETNHEEGADQDPDQTNPVQSNRLRKYSYNNSTGSEVWTYYYRVAPDKINSKTDYAQFASIGEDGSDLNVAFGTVMGSITKPSVELNGDDILRDVLSDYVDFLNGDQTEILVYTAAMQADGSFAEPVILAGAKVVFGKTDPDSDRYDIVDISGYDYKSEYISSEPRTVDGKDYYGSKLIVKVPVKVRDGFWGGNNVPTNEDTTAVYDVTYGSAGVIDEQTVITFPIPHINVPVQPQLTVQDHVVYYGESSLTTDNLLTAITMGGKAVKVEYDEASGKYVLNPAESWMADYADLNWIDGSAMPQTAVSGKAASAHTFGVVATSKNTEAASVGTVVPTEGYTATDVGTVQILVPVLTFMDSMILSGKHTDKEYYDGTNYMTNATKWVDMLNSTDASGKYTDVSATVTLGTEPTLDLTYTPEGSFTEDTAVDVTVYLNGEEINSVAYFEWSACASGLHNEATIPTHKADADQVDFWIHVSSIENDPNGLITNKTATPLDNTNTKFRLTLEAYATGKVKKMVATKPADIVLVLDHSASMRTPAGATNILYSPKAGYAGELYNGQGQMTKDKLDPAKGQRIGYYVAQSTTSLAWFVMEYDPATAKWIGYSVPSTESIVNKNKNLNDSNDKTYSEHTQVQSWTYDNLPSQLVYYKTQYAMLYESVLSFVKELRDSDVAHSVSIVGFAGSNTDGTRVYVGGDETAFKSYKALHHANTTQARREELYVKSMKNVAVDSEYEELLTLVEAIDTNFSFTCPSAGLDLANEVLEANPVDSNKRDRIVVLFTDGIPNVKIGEEQGNPSTTAEQIYDEVVKKAQYTKQTLGAKVYSISTATMGGSDRYFLNYSSSDYPNATGFATPGAVIDGAPKYTKEVNAFGDLDLAFGSITEQFTHTEVSLDDTAILVEVLTQYFEFIKNQSNQAEVRVYTQAYMGQGDWAEKELINTLDVDIFEIPVNKVTVTGFNYAEEYVSDVPRVVYDANGNVLIAEYYGKKLVLEVDVKTKDGFWGGDNVATNDVTTGLYPPDFNVPVEIFPVPEVNVPIDVQIDLKTEDKTIYFGGLNSFQNGIADKLDLTDLLKVTAGGVDVEITSEGFKPAQDWMDDFVTIDWTKHTETDAEGNETTVYDSTTFEDTISNTTPGEYPFSVTLHNKQTGEDITKTGTGKVSILVPEYTFRDTTVPVGYTPNLNAENLVSGPIWVDIVTGQEKQATDPATKPTMTLSYSFSGQIGVETPVNVTVTCVNPDVSATDIMGVVTFHWVDCDNGRNHDNDETVVTHYGTDSSIEFTIHTGTLVEDAVVIDFGLSVDIDLLANDTLLASDMKFLGFYQGAFVEGKDYLASDNGTFGKLEKISDTAVRYTLTKDMGMQMQTHEVFTYAVEYTVGEQAGIYYGTVKIIPATVIYYEDNFVTFDHQTTDQVVAGWASTDPEVQDALDKLQSADRIGTGNIYGYDSIYTDMTRFSMGTAMGINVYSRTENGGYHYVDGTACFTFWGTGFDIISLTSNTTGTIMVTVDRLDDDTVANRYLMVDTYYGYVYEDGKWSVSDSDDPNALYQIPVMKVEDLAYGKYAVEIYVAYGDVFDHGQYSNGSYDFYLDAIRIYNPANNGNDNDVIQGAYTGDGEGWPSYQELRNMLIKAESFGINGTTPGAVFIDGIASVGAANMANYQSYGPNNEVYLTKDQAVAFEFNALNMKDGSFASLGDLVDELHLSMKSVGGTAHVRIIDLDNGNKEVLNQQINSSTDLYYSLGDVKNHNLLIQNTGEGILSITNFKITYTSDPGQTVNLMDAGAITSDPDTLNMALAYLNVADPKIKIENASVAMEDEVKYNFYFSLGDASNVVEKGMLIFDEKLADGTIHDASRVIPGAVAVGEQYMVTTDSIPAKNMGDMVYFKIYVKLSDGSYAYTDVVGYNVVAYAKSVLKLETASAKSKALMVALLNYGAEAQKYFGYNTDNLMNAELTAEQQALVEAYDSSKISGLVSADPAKTGSFESTGSFGSYRTSACFEGAFSINYYVTPTVDAEVTMYYWTKADYEAAEELTVENATGAIVVTEGAATVSGIAAKEMEDTMYVAMVSEVDGVRYCSGVMAYSMATYCKSIANSDGAEMQALAQATLVYGGCAKGYFG